MEKMMDFLKKFWEDKPQRFQLKNGLELLVKEDHRNPLCSIQFWVPTGSMHEEAFLGHGLSHFLEHMVFKGSSKYGGKQAVELLHEVGGSLNAYTSFNRTVYHVELPSEALVRGLDVLGDIVFRPTLSSAEFESERQVVLREIDMCDDDPDSQLSHLLFETAYRNHPCRFPVIGHAALLKRLQLGDLAQYHARHYVPNRVTLVIVGAVDAQACKTLVEDQLGALPRGPEGLPALRSEPVQLGPRDGELFGDYELTRGTFAFKIPHMAHEDAPGLNALAHVLGYGYSAPLWQQLREGRCLVHSIEASVWNPVDPGVFSVEYTCDPEKHKSVQAVLLNEITGILHNGFSEKRLEQCLRHLVVGEINARKTVYGQASRIGLVHAMIGDPNYLPIYYERLEQLEPEDLVSLGERYIIEQGLTKVSIGPKEASSARPSKGASQAPFAYNETVLDNGARVFRMLDRGLPKVHVTVASLGGPLYDPLGYEGANHLLATLLTKDTKKLSAQQVAKNLESRAINFVDFCANNSLGLSAEALSLYQEPCFEAIAEGLLMPTFKPETLEREKVDQLAQIAELEDDSLSLTLRRLRQQFFQKHPYAVGSLGLENSVEALDRDLIDSCYRRLCVGPNTVVVVAGDYDDKDVDAFCQKLSGLSAEPIHKQHPSFSPPTEASSETFELKRQQAIFSQAYPGVGLTDRDYYVSEVLEELFSGMSSQLFFTVREDQGLAYFVGAGRMSGIATGMFYFYAGIEAPAAPKVAAAVQAEIARVSRGGVPAEELQSCKRRLLAKKLMSLQRIGERGTQLALNALYGLPLNEGEAYAAAIEAVSVADLARFCQTYLVVPTTLTLIPS